MYDPCSLSYAITVAVNGDTIYLADGDYGTAVTIELAAGVSLTAGTQADPPRASIYPTAAAANPLIELESATPGTNGNQSVSYIELNGYDSAAGVQRARHGMDVLNRDNITISYCRFENFITSVSPTSETAASWALRVQTDDITRSDYGDSGTYPYYQDGIFFGAGMALGTHWPTNPVENFQFHHNMVVNCGWREEADYSWASRQVVVFGLKDSDFYRNTFDASHAPLKCFATTPAVLENVNFSNNIFICNELNNCGAPDYNTLWAVEVWVLLNCDFTGNKLINGAFSTTYGTGCSWTQNRIDTGDGWNSYLIEATYHNDPEIAYNYFSSSKVQTGIPVDYTAGVIVGRHNEVMADGTDYVALVHHNIFSQIRAYGLICDAQGANVADSYAFHVYHNIFYDIGRTAAKVSAGVVLLTGSGAPTATVRMINNIFLDGDFYGAQDPDAAGSWTVDGNLWRGNLIDSSPASIRAGDLHAVTGLPLFAEDFKPAPGGAQLNAGQDLAQSVSTAPNSGMDPDTTVWGSGQILPQVGTQAHSDPRDIGPYADAPDVVTASLLRLTLTQLRGFVTAWGAPSLQIFPHDTPNLYLMTEESTAANANILASTYNRARLALEYLLRMLAYTGDSGSLTSDPPNDTSGYAIDSAGGFATDEHNGRLMLITSGEACGNFYTIDDTNGTTLFCTGDNLYADGVRSGDDYRVFYDFTTGQGHTHDGVDSAERGIPPTSAGNQVIAKRSATLPVSGTSGPTGYGYERAAAFMLGRAGSLRVVVTIDSTMTTTFRCIIARDGTAVGTSRAQAVTSGSSQTWTEDIGGWSIGDLLELYVEDAGATGTWTIEVCASAGKFNLAPLLSGEL